MGRKDMPVPAPGAIEKLMAYPWPGNVRELENMVERSLILSGGKPTTFEEMQTAVNQRAAVEVPRASHLENGDALALDVLVFRHIRRVLERGKGRVGGKGGAADMLHVNPSTLRKRMRKLGIPFGRKRNKD